MGYFVLWIIAAFVSAIVASNKNRSGVLWFFFTIILPPLVLIALVMPKVEKKSAEAATGQTSHGCIVKETLESGETVNVPLPAEIKCPMCAETIKGEALKCRFCGHDLSEWRKDYIEKHKNTSLVEAGHKNLGAEELLRTANYYRSNGQPEKAKAYYETITVNFPGTEHAQIAQKSISE